MNDTHVCCKMTILSVECSDQVYLDLNYYFILSVMRREPLRCDDVSSSASPDVSNVLLQKIFGSLLLYACVWCLSFFEKGGRLPLFIPGLSFYGEGDDDAHVDSTASYSDESCSEIFGMYETRGVTRLEFLFLHVTMRERDRETNKKDRGM